MDKIKVHENNIRWIKIPPDIIILRTIGVIMIYFSLQTVLCQSGYNITYDTGVALRILSIESNEDNIYLSGFYRKSETEHQSGFVVSIDTLGIIQWWSEIKDDSSSITKSIESGISLSSNYSIALPFGYFNRPSFVMAIIDSLGVIESIQEYPQDSASVTSPTDIIETSNGYLITGWASKPPHYRTDAFILKTDKIGNQQWLRFVGHSVYEENARTITKVNSNFYVISGTRFQRDIEPTFSYGWAYAFDSLGTQIWDWVADPDELPHRGIMSMQYDVLNHDWVYFTFFEKNVFIEELGLEVEMMLPVFVRRDSIMNFISYNEFGPYAFNHYMGVLETSLDGCWIAAGNTTCFSEDHPTNCSQESGRIIKLSYNDTLEWSVIDTAFFHPELGSRSYLRGVTESPSGSIYAVGWANNYDENEVYRSYGWLLKITKDGCVGTLCTTSSLIRQIQDRESKVKVYPNPASDYLTILLADDILNPAYIELYDLTGNRLIRQIVQHGTQSINLEMATNGILLWRILNRTGLPLASGKVLVEK
jgi:hypothetical protein